MGHSNKTTNVGLPIISDNDKPTWMGDFNFAMYTLDQAVNSGQKLTEAFTALVTKASEDAEFARTEALNAKVKVEAFQTVADGIGNVAGRLSEVERAASLATASAASSANATQQLAATYATYRQELDSLKSGVSGLSGRVATLEQSGPGGTGGGSSVDRWAASCGPSSNVAVSSNEQWRVIPLSANRIASDTRGGWDNNGIKVPTDGFYTLSGQLVGTIANTTSDMLVRVGITVNDSSTPVRWMPAPRIQAVSGYTYSGSLNVMRNLSSGSIVNLVVMLPNNSTRPFNSSVDGTELNVVRVA